MKKVIKAIFILCSLFIILPQHQFEKDVSAQEDTINIVTSFYPMYALTETLVDGIHPVTMINSQNGIHGFEPSAADVATITESDLFIYHSDVLESWVKKLKRNLKDNEVHIIEAAADLEMDRVAGLENVTEIKGMSQESMQDPHTWLDPIEAANEIQLIAEGLAAVDPENAAIYQERADAFTKEAEEIVAKYEPLFAQVENKTFVTQHTAFSYLAKRFGLNQLGIAGISSDVEPGSKQLTQVIQFINDNNVSVIFVEPGINPKPAEMIAAETGAQIVLLSPLEAIPENDLTFIENLRKEIDALYQGLKQ